MFKNMVKGGVALAASTLLVLAPNAQAAETGFPNWQACDDYMFGAYQECIGISQSPNSGVTYAMCQASWEVTCNYCDTQYPQ